MNVYLINLGHARPELERSIIFYSLGPTNQEGTHRVFFLNQFNNKIAQLAAKEGEGYFVKSVTSKPFIMTIL